LTAIDRPLVDSGRLWSTAPRSSHISPPTPSCAPGGAVLNREPARVVRPEAIGVRRRRTVLQFIPAYWFTAGGSSRTGAGSL